MNLTFLNIGSYLELFLKRQFCSGFYLENIRFAKPEASQEEVEAACIAANAHEFISKLEGQYSHEIAEMGVGLSGGQRQRIAIARAILKDPKILILDEATSALDNESEKVVQIALDNLMKGRTTFVIAHRISTIVNADKIVVLEKGQIIAEGTHQELLETSPMYKTLYALQALLMGIKHESDI